MKIAVIQGPNLNMLGVREQQVYGPMKLEQIHTQMKDFADQNNIEIECSLKWNAGYSEDMFACTNTIHQKDGGTHLLGLRSALTRVINKYATENNFLKNNKVTPPVMVS